MLIAIFIDLRRVNGGNEPENHEKSLFSKNGRTKLRKERKFRYFVLMHVLGRRVKNCVQPWYIGSVIFVQLRAIFVKPRVTS